MRYRAVVAVASRDPLVLGALAGHEVAVGRRVVPHHIGLGSVWSSQRRAQRSPATMDLRRRANPHWPHPRASGRPRKLGVGVAMVSRLFAVEVELIGERPAGGLPGRLSRAAERATRRRAGGGAPGVWWAGVHVCRGCATALVSSRHRVPPELTRLMTDALGRGREPK